jgi:hypothetical protein
MRWQRPNLTARGTPTKRNKASLAAREICKSPAGENEIANYAAGAASHFAPSATIAISAI